MILLVYGFLNIANSQLWVSFSPISDLTEDFFGHWGGASAVNMLAVTYSIMYLPGTVLGAVSIKSMDIRGALLLAGALTVAGSFIRGLGVSLISYIGPVGAYLITIVGQAIAALGQPLFMNIPAALASTWFAIDERDIATSVASMCNPLGNAIGQILPSIFVMRRGGGDDDDSTTIVGMLLLMIVQCAWALLGLLLAYLFFDAAPPTPPSASTQLRQGIRILNRKTDISSATIVKENRRTSKMTEEDLLTVK